ncbi:hypothetical protein [Edaphobacter dinghuensis]|uniref:Uncharacterized protein n=1 Tax=Edaphobacter dinghuensis TaxID=1560005 RepID=A0A917M0I4_9BACT|nr:hypothetical protein [Edaphobacter dinghuensis]GGG71211.1 hypothetical protein GCM10011585_11760 [Edaphobacter dinghuensis]
MTSSTAARLVRFYPRRWRTRYGQEFAALLEQHPISFKIVTNVLWSAGEAHMQAAMSQERNQGNVVGSVWSAWMIAVIAGLILYGMVDDSPLLAAMGQSSILAASWKMIQAGCVLAVSALVVAGLPLAWSIGLNAIRKRRRSIYLQLAVPLISITVFIAWIAAVLAFTNGHWAASPWAVAFSRPDWPSYSVRWITGAISAALLILCCSASAASISQLIRGDQFPELHLALPGIDVKLHPLSFAAALSPLAAAGIFVMLMGVVVWGYSAIHLSALAFHNSRGPLGLSGVASWILSTIILGLAAAISAPAAWRSWAHTTDH